MTPTEAKKTGRATRLSAGSPGALAVDPDILLMENPFFALDVQARDAFHVVLLDPDVTVRGRATGRRPSAVPVRNGAVPSANGSPTPPSKRRK
jgi:hypothetical protein